MGKLMLKTIPDFWYWDYRHQEVRFCAWQNSEVVMCRISRKAIEDLYGDAPSPRAYVQVTRQHVYDICNRFGGLLTQGRYENDGSVLLRPTDW
jgi:hypothetical protein